MFGTIWHFLVRYFFLIPSVFLATKNIEFYFQWQFSETFRLSPDGSRDSLPFSLSLSLSLPFSFALFRPSRWRKMIKQEGKVKKEECSKTFFPGLHCHTYCLGDWKLDRKYRFFKKCKLLFHSLTWFSAFPSALSFSVKCKFAVSENSSTEFHG